MTGDGPRAAKYGMPASESHRYLAHHFLVMGARKLASEQHFARFLRISPDLRDALAILAGDHAGAEQVGKPEPVAVVATPELAQRANLRTALGLR